MLERINNPNDIKKLNDRELEQLAKDIRVCLLENVSKTGGHLASNLGVVEITLAVHKFMDFPKDKLIFDVGHQSYVHKILTGRKDDMASLRQFKGISGFPDPQESECDAFISGHASNSLSAALGFAAAKQLNNSDEKIVAVIGDGALTGGMAQEALNNAASLNTNLVIILNDNEHSISANVGALSNYLGRVRTSRTYFNIKRAVGRGIDHIPIINDFIYRGIHKTKESIKRLFIPGMLFEDLGITYIGPLDGHDIPQLSYALEYAFKFNGPVIIHALTIKGKGYCYAENDPSRFHGIDAFDVKTGRSLKSHINKTYTQVFSDKLLELARKDKDIVAITAAMEDGTGLKKFHEEFPERYFDVGIAEQHAVTFAAGLAAAGKKPVFAVYSTFLQRGFDQIVHDVALQKLPVIFAVDRAGLVGNDGKTHNGIFDESFLSMIPNLIIMSPKNGRELEEMLEYAFKLKAPVAIRYPRGEVSDTLDQYHIPVVLNENEVLRKGKDIALLATGNMVETAVNCGKKLEEAGYDPTIINLRFLHDIDEKMTAELSKDHRLLVTIEESVYTGSYGQRLAAYLKSSKTDLDIINISLPDRFIEHGSINELRNKYGLTEEEIISKITAVSE